MTGSSDVRAGVPSPAGPRLLDRVRGILRLRHYSRRTEEAYVGWIRRFIRFHHLRHPVEMGAAEINRFLSDLATGGGGERLDAEPGAELAVFLYTQALDLPPVRLQNVVRARLSKRLPVILTLDEVESVLAALQGVVHLVCNLLYGGGLRLQEGLQLRVKDVDLDRHEIVIRSRLGTRAFHPPLAERCAHGQDLLSCRQPCCTMVAMQFTEELAYFIANQDELVRQHRGKYVVLIGSKVVGVFDTALDAFLESSTKYQPGTFMVQKCEPGPSAYTATVSSSVASF